MCTRRTEPAVFKFPRIFLRPNYFLFRGSEVLFVLGPQIVFDFTRLLQCKSITLVKSDWLYVICLYDHRIMTGSDIYRMYYRLPGGGAMYVLQENINIAAQFTWFSEFN